MEVALGQDFGISVLEAASYVTQGLVDSYAYGGITTVTPHRREM